MGLIVFLILFGKSILKVLLILGLIILVIAVLWRIFDKWDQKTTEKRKHDRLNNPEVAKELNKLKLIVLCYQRWFCSLDPFCSAWYRDKRHDRFAYLEMKFDRGDDWKDWINRYEKFISFDEQSKKIHLESWFFGTDYNWIENNISMNVEKVECDNYSNTSVYFPLFINLDSEFDRDIVIDALIQYLRNISDLSDYKKEFNRLNSLVFSKPQDKVTSSLTVPTAPDAKPTSLPKPTNPVAPKSINAFLNQTQLPTNREITLGINKCDIKGGFADRHIKIKKLDAKWVIYNISLECSKNDKVTTKVNGNEILSADTPYELHSGDTITLVGVFNEVNYKFTIK